MLSKILKIRNTPIITIKSDEFFGPIPNILRFFSSDFLFRRGVSYRGALDSTTIKESLSNDNFVTARPHSPYIKPES